MTAFSRLAKPEYLYSPGRLVHGLCRRLLPNPKGSRIVSLPWGARLGIDPSEEIGATIWLHGLYDLAVTEAIWRLLSPGDTAVDGGANIGYMAVLMAGLVAPHGRVVAFEPHREIFEELSSNLALFENDAQGSVPELDARREAISDISGAAHLVEPSDFATNRGRAYLSESTEGQVVRTVTLDEAFPREEIHLLKLDLEGKEVRALKGAETLLRDRRIKHLVCEAHESQSQTLHQSLASFGYTLFGLGRTFSRPVLSRGSQRPPLPAHEAPSLLATSEPTFVERRFERPGWLCLRGIRAEG